MPNPLYQQLQPQNTQLNMLMQFRQNPIGVLSQRFNIPQGMNDPNVILQHLLNTNQVSQDQVNRVMQMRNNPQVQQLFK
ncbi:MAG: hypothetical protein J6Y02_06210 [Pseudobutyrivibrio sp.]|nr:hypothetical protein [Pseudobutyrivibrio sp.]